MFLPVALFLLSLSAQAQVSPGVSPERSSYDSIDQLEAFGCAYATSRILRPQAFADLRDAVYVAETEALCAAPELASGGAGPAFLPPHHHRSLGRGLLPPKRFPPVEGAGG